MPADGQMIHFRLDDPSYAEAKQLAKHEDRALANLLRILIREALSARKLKMLPPKRAMMS